jgi:hypothetical protein
MVAVRDNQAFLASIHEHGMATVRRLVRSTLDFLPPGSAVSVAQQPELGEL